MKKLIRRPRKPNYCLAPFRKSRSKKVIDFLLSSKILLSQTNLKSSQSRSFKSSILTRLKSVTFFDQKRYRTFLIKYVKFIKYVLEVDVTTQIDFLVSRWEDICLEHGPVEALKVFKNLYSIATRIMTSNDFQPLPFRKSNKRGEPKLLGPLLGLLKGTYKERRAALNCLSLFKVIDYHGDDYSLSTIVKEAPIPLKDFSESPVVGDYLKRFIKAKGYIVNGVNLNLLRRKFFETLEKEFPDQLVDQRLSDISSCSKIHVSGRNGPNGPCISTAICDWAALQKDDEGRNLLSNIKKMSNLTQNASLNELIDSFSGEPESLSSSSKREVIHSKISLKGEPWGRLRPFAICDYFSQSSLAGLHTYLFRWLESQPEDGTYKQDSVSEAVRIWTEDPMDENSCESADLSAATDSIPVEVQGEILSKIAGKDFAKVWVNIVSNRSFKGPGGENIKYQTGQPMGILSSWGMLAVWHHIIVRTCQAYVDQNRSLDVCNYYIIGDDIALRGRKLFKVYSTFVENVQGVGISKLKGFHSETQNLNYPLQDPNGILDVKIHTAELAKRVYSNGIEMSVVPANEVLTSSENILQFPELFRSLQTRKFDTSTNIRKVPAIAKEFFLKRKDSIDAITLTTFPIRDAPLFKEDDYLNVQGDVQFDNIFWFSPKYDKLDFVDQITRTVMFMLAMSVPSTFLRFSKWSNEINKGDKRCVKSWNYDSCSQTKLLEMVLTNAKALYTSVLVSEDLVKSFPKEQPINWLHLLKMISCFQTLDEIDNVFSNNNKLRNTDRITYKVGFISKEILQATKAYTIKTANSGKIPSRIATSYDLW